MGPGGDGDGVGVVVECDHSMQPINPVPSRGATIGGGDKIRRERGMIKVRGQMVREMMLGPRGLVSPPQRQGDEQNIYCGSRDG